MNNTNYVVLVNHSKQPHNLVAKQNSSFILEKYRTKKYTPHNHLVLLLNMTRRNFSHEFKNCCNCCNCMQAMRTSCLTSPGYSTYCTKKDNTYLALFILEPRVHCFVFKLYICTLLTKAKPSKPPMTTRRRKMTSSAKW